MRPAAGPGTSRIAGHVHAASQRWQQTVETLGHRQTRSTRSLPELEAQAESPVATDDDQRALRSAEASRKLTAGQLADLQGEYWIGVLEEPGCCPTTRCSTTPSPSTSACRWLDPDTGEYETDSAQYQRNSALALREFAPGATFYAGG